jgi:hypothetical protein
MIHRKEKQSKGMKGDSRNSYQALLIFYMGTNIPMIRCSFERPGFCANPDNLLTPLKVDPTQVFGGCDTPELSFDETFISSEQFDPRQLQQQQQPRRRRILGPTKPVIIFIAYMDATTVKCALCGDKEDEEPSGVGEQSNE